MSPVGTITIGDGRIELLVLPESGGKVTELRCLRHGRQWLAESNEHALPGSAPGEYGAAEAWGWDELFPTVMPGASTPPPWPAPLRDHGELWGRPWRTLAQRADSLELEYADPDLGFRFRRRLTVRDGRVECEYSIRSEREEEVPFQWSMHPILSLQPGERIGLPGIEQVKATMVVNRDLPEAPAILDWPRHGNVDLGTVAASDGETLLKLYAGTTVDNTVAVTGGECELSFRTDPEFAPYVGIYVNYGGWPAGGPLHHVGIEPTNAPEDDLAAGLAGGAAVSVLAAGATVSWKICLSLGARCART